MTHENRQKKLVIISSEPLTSDNTDWYVVYRLPPQARYDGGAGSRIAVPENHTLVVTQDIHTFLAPIALLADVEESEMTASLRRIYGISCWAELISSR